MTFLFYFTSALHSSDFLVFPEVPEYKVVIKKSNIPIFKKKPKKQMRIKKHSEYIKAHFYSIM